MTKFEILRALSIKKLKKKLKDSKAEKQQLSFRHEVEALIFQTWLRTDKLETNIYIWSASCWITLAERTMWLELSYLRRDSGLNANR